MMVTSKTRASAASGKPRRSLSASSILSRAHLAAPDLFKTTRVSKLAASTLIAGGVLGIATETSSADSCIGNCGTMGANGVVTAAPSGAASYQYISTYNGITGAGQLPGIGGNNGSQLTTTAFNAIAGSVLSFNFNYVTTDGGGYTDYAWAQVQTPSGTVVATLITARTATSGSVIPGVGLPATEATLTPASVPIIGSAPVWSGLGSSSGGCFDIGCGYTGWVNSSYTLTSGGTYVLVFGVSNWSDGLYQSGLAIDGVVLDGTPIAGQNIDLIQAYYLSSDVNSGSVSPNFVGGTLRLNVANGVYAQTFTLDGSTTNTLDQFGSASRITGSLVDATPGTPGNIVFANSGIGGSITLTGTNTYSGTTTINNGAAVILGNGGSISNSSIIFNSGLFQVDAGAQVNVSGVTNYASGTILNYGSIIDALNNYGLLVNAGSYTADVNNFPTGTILNTGTFTSGTFNNAGLVVSSGTLTASNSVTNSGIMDVQGTFSTPTLNNSGTFTHSGATTIAIGTVTNSGTYSMINGVTTDRLNTTTYSSNNGVLGIDVNSNAASGQRADLLTTTNLNGNVSLRVANVGPAGYISSPIPVIAASSVAPGTSVAVINNPGVINYEVQRDGNTYSLVSTLNTSVAAATPTGINSILTAMNTGFYQNASAFVSDPPNPAPNQVNGGPWIRLSTGRNDVSSTTASADLTGTNFAASKVRSDFDGFQVGVDLGVANVQNQGWNTHVGVTAGQVNLRTFDLASTTNIRTQANVPFVGLYGQVNGHGFFADAQVRGDFYNMRLTNTVAGLGNTPLGGTAVSANVSGGYRYNLPENWFVEPSVAFLYTKLHTDTLNVPLGGGAFASQAFDPFESALGRAGLRVGTNLTLEKVQLNLQPFMTGSVWREFAGNSTSRFISNGVAIPLTVTRVGTFGQIGAGVAAQIAGTGALGFIRGDYRFGDSIQGYALVAGFRYQF